MSLWRRELVERLSPLGLKPDREAEIVEELAQHLEDRVRDLVALGFEPAAARSAALQDLDAPGELARRLAEIVPQPLNLPPRERRRADDGCRRGGRTSGIPSDRSADPLRSP
jgi:hypothetical protein